MAPKDDLYGLDPDVTYRIPATSVSYKPQLANRQVKFTGRMMDLPAGGGRMAEFKLLTATTWAVVDSGEFVWLRPFAVVPAYGGW